METLSLRVFKRPIVFCMLSALAAACAATETEGDIVAEEGTVDQPQEEDAAAPCDNDQDCDDGIACTVDHCEEGTCVHTPCEDCCEEGLSCLPDFGCGPAPLPCTTDEACVDDIRCTLDRCLDETYCQNLPQNGLCEEGEICLAALGCIPRPPDDCAVDDDCFPDRPCLGEWKCVFEFGCQFVSLLDCDDGDDCTDDTCVDAEGGCVRSTRDGDGDGFGDAACGGDDCDDGAAEVFPGAEEACNGIDDDCDGETDEGCCVDGSPCTTTCGTEGTRDCNPDGSEGPCLPPDEICNDEDDDCDGETDEGFDCRVPETTSCTTSCSSAGTRTCLATCLWGPCEPPDETCNGADDDCDGARDNGFGCVLGATTSCTSACGSTGSRACEAGCAWGDCEPPDEICNGADDDCDGSADEGFACVAGSSGTCPTACGSTGTRQCLGNCTWDLCQTPAESCNGQDDDCDGACDDGFTCCAGQPTACSLLGYVGGTAICLTNCAAWDTSGCTNCGNGTIDPGEQCDGSNLGGNNCTTVGMGFAGGTLHCASACTFDVTGCHFCGNGVIDVGEDCDGSDLGGASCTTVPGGFTGGNLGCSPTCAFDTTQCTSFDPSGTYVIVPAPYKYCAYGLVNFNISTMVFSDSGSVLVVTGAPCSMTGSSARSSGHINVTCTLYGTCDEIYALTGDFTGSNTWAGTFTATFVGSCLNCTNQSWSVTGTK
jgi:hypothetical protein